jgi:hypothetical protein
MKGRVEDAILRRFLSPDRIIQDPSNAQNYNRYTYVLNNPLTFIDPSGFACGAPSPPPQNPGPAGSADLPTNSLDEIIVTAQCPGPVLLDLPPIELIPAQIPDVPIPQPVAIAPPSKAEQAQDAIKQFLCAQSEDAAAKALLDFASNAGDAGELSSAAVAVEAATAGAGRVAWPQATNLLGSYLANGLSKVARIGQFASGLALAGDALTGNAQAFVFDAIDISIYSTLSEVGAGGAWFTGGFSVAAAGATGLLYYTAGGAKGLIQGSAICQQQ